MQRQRETAIDLLRGLVMVIMVIDHAQEYQAGPGRGLVTDPMNLAVTPGIVYFWRILAHFCAPCFTLLMGMSAAISGASSGKLVKRGLVLLALEATVMNWAWTFNPFWHRYFFQVIGALGCAMIALAGARRFSGPVVGGVGLALVAGHNLFDGVHFAAGTAGHWVWSLLHEKNVLALGGGFEVRTTYPIVPVVGLALCGYALAPLYTGRSRWVERLGWAAVGAFVVLRGTGVYGDPHGWDGSVASFFNVTKYPLSLQFVLMTVGPALLFLAWGRGWRQAQLEQLGRTAMVFYIGHLVLLHAAALGVALAMGWPIDLAGRFGGIPEQMGFPVWATAPLAGLAIAVLYPLCRWYEPRRWRYL